MVLVDHGGFGVMAAGCGGKCCFFFFSPLFRLCYLLTLFFFWFPPVNGVPASLQWLRGGVVGASGASGGDEDEDGPWYTEDVASVFFSVFSSSSSCFSCASFTPLPLFLSQIFFPFPVLLSFYVHGFPFFFLFFLSVFSPFFPVFFLPLLLLLPLCLFLLPLVRFLLWLYN